MPRSYCSTVNIAPQSSWSTFLLSTGIGNGNFPLFKTKILKTHSTKIGDLNPSSYAGIKFSVVIII